MRDWFHIVVVVFCCLFLVMLVLTVFVCPTQEEKETTTVWLVYDMEFHDMAGYVDKVVVVSWITVDGVYNALQFNNKEKAMKLFEKLKCLEAESSQ